MAMEVNNSISAEVLQMAAARKPVADSEQRQAVKSASTDSRVRDQQQTEATANKPAEEKSQQQRANEQLQEAVAELNSFVQNINRSLQFNVDNESGGTIIKVLDSETEELIRQIPSAELLELSKRIEENAGLILKTKA